MDSVTENCLKLIILFSSCTASLAARSFVIEFESLRNEVNYSIIETFTIDLIRDGNRQVFNGSIVNAIQIEQYDINVIGYFFRNNGRKSKVFNISIDGCGIVQRKFDANSQISNLVMTYVRKGAHNLPAVCPFKKGWEVYVSKYFVDAEKFPPYLPESRFEIQINMICNKIFAYRSFIIGAIISKAKKNFGENHPSTNITCLSSRCVFFRKPK